MGFSDITNALGLTKTEAKKAEVILKRADLDKNGTVEGAKESLELARILAEQSGELSAGTIKALKAQVKEQGGEVGPLYNVFGDQSNIAQSTANTTIHGIEDMVNLINRNTGTNFKYEDLQTEPFPQPENFLPAKEKLTDSDRAVAYGEWRAAVTEWKEGIKDKLETLNEMNTRMLSQQMDKGFMKTYINQGITLDTIISVYKDLDGDMEAVKKKLDELQEGQARISGQIEGAKQEVINSVRSAELREMERDFGIPSEGTNETPDVSEKGSGDGSGAGAVAEGAKNGAEEAMTKPTRDDMLGRLLARPQKELGFILDKMGIDHPPVNTDKFKEFLLGLSDEVLQTLDSARL